MGLSVLKKRYILFQTRHVCRIISESRLLLLYFSHFITTFVFMAFVLWNQCVSLVKTNTGSNCVLWILWLMELKCNKDCSIILKKGLMIKNVQCVYVRLLMYIKMFTTWCTIMNTVVNSSELHCTKLHRRDMFSLCCFPHENHPQNSEIIFSLILSSECIL